MDQQGLSAVQCGDGEQRRLQWRESFTTGQDLQNKNEIDRAMLDTLFSRIQAQVGSAYVPITIALADPWVRQILLSFEALPRTRQERQALVQWRLAKEWQIDMEHATFSWQYLGEQDGHHAVLAQSVRRDLLEPLLQVAGNHKLMLTNIDAIGNYLLNRLEDTRDMIMIHVQPDYWSLYVTNQQGWPLYRRSKWQAAPDSGAALDVFAAHLERTAISVNRHKSKQIVLATDGLQADSLAGVLEKRFGIVPVMLPNLPCKGTAELSSRDVLAMQSLEVT